MLQEAIKHGLSRYFTGSPCKNGHISQRATKTRNCLTCERLRGRFRRATSPETLREYGRKYRYNLRLAALDFLGHQCGECGVTDFRVLQIDHVNGNGAAERRTYGNSPSKILKRVLNGDKNYQILCANCNWLKRIEKGESINTRKLAELRTKLLKTFGNKCSVCGFASSDCLQLDHIHGDGTKERKLLGHSRMYTYAINNPKNYQLLCANCNWIKRHKNKECKSK